MNIGKLYFAITRYVVDITETPLDVINNFVKTTYKFNHTALVYQISKNKFVDLNTGEKYKSYDYQNLKVGDRVISLDEAIPFCNVVTNASTHDSKKEILRKASMVKITKEDNIYKFSYKPTETVYLSVLDKEFVKIALLLQLLYKNGLIVEDYQVRKYSNDNNEEPKIYIYMQVSGKDALSKLESISKKFNISHMSSNLEDIEEYKNDVTYQKQKRINH